MISDAMANSMIDVGFTPEEIRAYLDKQPEALTFGKTKSRTLVARLNKSVEMTNHVLSTEGYYEDVIEQRHANLINNQLLVCEDNYKVCFHPADKFREYLDLLLET